MNLLSLYIKVWVRHPVLVGGTIINRDPQSFHLIALSSSVQNLHFTVQDRCSSSCQYIHMMVQGKGLLEVLVMVLPLKFSTLKEYLKSHSHPNEQNLFAWPHLASREDETCHR